MTKSELQSIKDLLRNRINWTHQLILANKSWVQCRYTKADPNAVDGQLHFEDLNEAKDTLRHNKAKLARLVALQKSIKKVLRNDA